MWLLYAVGSAFFCRTYFDTCKMWDTEDGFHSSDGSAHSSNFDFFVDHSWDCGIGGADSFYTWKDPVVFDPFRCSYRCFLALLFPGIAAWRY